MALYLGNQKIAGGGGGGSRNANIVSCDNYEDYQQKLAANLAAGKLSVSYYTPVDDQPDMTNTFLQATQPLQANASNGLKLQLIEKLPESTDELETNTIYATYQHYDSLPDGIVNITGLYVKKID